MTTMRNVRFWTDVNGSPVKLTLKPGTYRHHSQGMPTDEGWSRTSMLWGIEDGVLVEEIFQAGADCDGRYESSTTYVCALDRLDAGHEDIYHTPGNPGHLEIVRYPAWECDGQSQRDYAAEAAGY